MVVIKALRDQVEAVNVNKPFEKLCQTSNKDIGLWLDGQIRYKEFSFFLSESYYRIFVCK